MGRNRPVLYREAATRRLPRSFRSGVHLKGVFMSDPVAPPVPVAPPPLPVPAVAYAGPAVRNENVDYASFGQRLGAWLIDRAIVAAGTFFILFLAGMVLSVVGEDVLERDGNARTIFSVGLLLTLVLAPWPYYALCEASRWRGTVGKRAVGIQVEDVEGGHATRVQTSVRFFLKFVSAALLGVGYLMAAFTKRYQALHDIGANTVVTRAPRRP